MKVSILHYSSYPVIGGVETIIEAHAKLFKKYGCCVKLVVGVGKSFNPKIPVRVIPEMRALHLVDRKVHQQLQKGKPGKAFYNLENLLYKKLKKELSESSVCISHNILSMHFNLALTSAMVKIVSESLNKRKKFISWAHDATFLDPNYRREWRNLHPWNLLSKPVTGLKLVTISEMRKKKLKALLKVKASEIEVIPDGIDPSSFLNLSTTGWKLFQEFNLVSYDFVFLYPTRLVRRKNIELAIELTSILNSKGRKSCLLITSPPDPHNKDSILYYNSLKKLAKELNVSDETIFLSEHKFDGKKILVDNNLLRDLYLLSDMLLFPSKSEGFGIPILESGICRLPVACSKINPLTEVGGKDVIYLDLNKSKDMLTKTLLRFCDKNMSLKLYKRVMRNYTWDSIFQKKIIPLVGARQP